MPDTTKYNGHANWATWNVCLWFDNDEGLYLEKQRIVARYGGKIRGEQAEAIVKQAYPEGTPDFDSPAEFDDVDWEEIALSWSDPDNDTDDGTEKAEPVVNAKLSHYFSGSGAFHFIWKDEDNNAISRPFTEQDARDYLASDEAAYLRKQDWRVVELYGQWVIVKFLKRIDAGTLLIDGQEFYYTVAPLDFNDEDCPVTEIRDYRVTITAKIADRIYEVKHISTRAIIVFFLNNEAALAGKFQ